MINRDLLTSSISQEGLFKAFPAYPTHDESPLYNLLGMQKGGDEYLYSYSVAVPHRQVSARQEIDPHFWSSDEVQLKTYESIKLIGAEIQTVLAKFLWEDIDRLTSPDIVDAQTGMAIPSVASSVLSCDNHTPDSQEARDRLIALTRRLRLTASQSALSPCEWVIITHPGIWYSLASSWRYPFQRWEKHRDWDCSYCGSHHADPTWICSPGCGSSHGEYICLYCGRSYPDHKNICWDVEYGVGCGAIEAMVRISDVQGLKKVLEDKLDFHDWMTETSKLPIDGFLYEVITDALAPMDSLYILPKTALSIPVTIREFIPAQDSIEHIKRHGLPHGNLLWSDDGQYMWTTENVRWNYIIAGRTKQRIVIKTPQLAGKLTHISQENLWT